MGLTNSSFVQTDSYHSSSHSCCCSFHFCEHKSLSLCPYVLQKWEDMLSGQNGLFYPYSSFLVFVHFSWCPFPLSGALGADEVQREKAVCLVCEWILEAVGSESAHLPGIHGPRPATHLHWSIHKLAPWQLSLLWQPEPCRELFTLPRALTGRPFSNQFWKENSKRRGDPASHMQGLPLVQLPLHPIQGTWRRRDILDPNRDHVAYPPGEPRAHIRPTNIGPWRQEEL